ncbi:MAG: Sec-independent protein translocase protein TatB [Pseudomonadota bacterium]|jgi:sec-independent protein translocase protein TatB
MFDIGWSELLVIGIVALLVVGPKELPVMLRVIGRYVAMVKRQADEFRAQFGEAMREAEFDQIRKDVSDIKAGAEETLRDVKRSFDEGLEEAPLKTDKEKAEESKRRKEADLLDDGFDDEFEDLKPKVQKASEEAGGKVNGAQEPDAVLQPAANDEAGPKGTEPVKSGT